MRRRRAARNFYCRRTRRLPTNFLFSNPSAIKAAIDSGGKTCRWLSELLEDAVEGGRFHRKSTSAFKVGENLAVTPGDVVMHTSVRTHQYAPKPSRSIVDPLRAPIINKYYAFDLAGRSLFEFLVRAVSPFLHGISEPEPEHDHWEWNLYRGDRRAFRAVQEISGVEDPTRRCGAAPTSSVWRILLRWASAIWFDDAVRGSPGHVRHD